MLLKKAEMSVVFAALSLILISGRGETGGPELSELRGRPANVLLIMIDDLGWTDLHIQGNDRLSTPVIDQLSARGGNVESRQSGLRHTCGASQGRVLAKLDELNLAEET